MREFFNVLKFLVADPTIQLPGMDLPRGHWCVLNRFRTDAGPCRSSLHKWGYLASPLCDCGEPQTMRHMIDDCPLSHLDGGIKALHLAEDPAVNWIMDFKTRST